MSAWHDGYRSIREDAKGFTDQHLRRVYRDASEIAHETGSERDKGFAAALRDERMARNETAAVAKARTAPPVVVAACGRDDA